MITSVQNPEVKGVVRLHQKKYRDEEGLILIEGYHALEEAIKAGLSIQTIFHLAEAKMIDGLVNQAIAVSEAVMKKMSTTETPLPILATALKPKMPSIEVFEKNIFFALGLCGLQDPGNMGTIARSACAFHIDAILTLSPSVDPYSPKVIRSSTGLIFRKPILEFSQAEQLLHWVQGIEGLTCWAADPHEGVSYRQAAYGRKILLLLGAEAHGIPEAILQSSNRLHIPMAPEVESLNVATSGAILMSEIYQALNAL